MDINSSLAEKLCNSLPYLIIITDQNAEIGHVNKNTLNTLNYTEKELIGRKVTDIIPDALTKHKKNWQTYIIKKNGDKVPVFQTVNKIKYQKIHFYIYTSRDISDQITEYNKNQELIECNKLILNHLEMEADFHSFISNVIQEIAKLLNFPIGHFYKLDKNKKLLVSSNIFYIQQQAKYQEFVKVTKKYDFKKGEGLPGSVWLKKSIVYCENIYEAKNFPRAKLSTKLNVQGGVGLPIIYKNEFLGVIELYSENKFIIKKHQLYQLENISKLISIFYGLYRENFNLNLILNSAGEGIYGLDLNGNATFVNPSACKSLKYNEKELIGQQMHKKVHYKYPDGKFYPIESCAVHASLTKGNINHIKREVLWDKNKKAVPVKYTCTPIYEHGEISGAVVIFSNISKETKMQDNIYEIENIQQNYIKGKPIDILFHEVIEYLIKFTEANIGFIGTINEENAEISIHQSNLQKSGFIRKEKSKKIQELPKTFQQAIISEQKIYLNEDEIKQLNFSFPLSTRRLSSVLIIPITGANNILAIVALANNNKNFEDKEIQSLNSIYGTLSSIIESHKYHQLTDKLAITDHLTQLYNRNYFELYFSNLLAIAEKKHKKFCLLMIDLYKFKMVNDTYGHLKGDEFLKNFAKVLLNCTPKEGIVARVGGDEFFILLPNLESYQTAEKVAESIIKKSKKRQETNQEMINCLPCIGITGYPLSGKNKEELLRRVDFALYNAKENPNKDIVFFNKELDKKYLKNNHIENAIPSAFKNKQLYCVFQPQINIENEDVYGVEVLIRWHHPSLGEIFPNEFINIIERIGQAEILNKYVVNEAINKLSTLKINKPLKVSVNISPKVQNFSLHIKDIYNIINQKVINKNITFCLEMTETNFINDNSNYMEHVNESIKFLKRHNIDFAIDDFGVEHSSIQRLITYNFSTIKIDQIFTQKLDSNDNLSAIAVVKAIMGLSNDLGFQVIAEGTESKQQIKILKSLGCTLVQGYYYYRPLQFNNFAKIMQA